MTETPYCRKGHALVGDNLRIRIKNGGVVCKTCRREQDRARSKAHPKGRGRPSDRTHCPHGHEYTPENTRRKPNGARYCRTCKNASTRAQKLQFKSVDESLIRRVLEALHEGKTLNQINGRCGSRFVAGTRIIQREKLVLFCAANPKLGSKIKSLGERNRATSLKNYGLARRKAAPQGLLSGGQDAAAIIRVATQGVWAPIKEEIQSDLYLAVLEGRLMIKDIEARVREFIAARNRLDRHSMLNRWGHLSLTAPLADNEGFTLGDVLTRGLWDE